MKRKHVIISGILVFTVVFPLLSMYSPALEQAMSDEANMGTVSDDSDDQSMQDAVSQDTTQDATQEVSSQDDGTSQVNTPAPVVQATQAAPLQAPEQETVHQSTNQQIPAQSLSAPAASAPMMIQPPAATGPRAVIMQEAPAPTTPMTGQSMSVPMPVASDQKPVQEQQAPSPQNVAQTNSPAPYTGPGGLHTHTEHNLSLRHHGHGPQVSTLPVFGRTQEQTHEIEYRAWQAPTQVTGPRHTFAGNTYSRANFRQRNKRRRINNSSVVVQGVPLPPIPSFAVPEPEDRVTPASQQVYAMEQQQVPRGDLSVPMPTYPCKHMGNMPNDLSLDQQLNWLITDGCAESLNRAQVLLNTIGRKKYIRYVLRKYQERVEAARDVIQSTVKQR